MPRIAKNMNIAQATERLRQAGIRIAPETVRLGILQGALPIGICIEGEKQPRCIVFERLLNEWLDTISIKEDEDISE